MHPVFRLYEDVLSTGRDCRIPAAAAAAFHLRGARLGHHRRQAVNEGEAWQGEGATLVKPGATAASPAGAGSSRAATKAATVADAPGMMSHEKLTAFLETMPKGDLLMRGDSVAFPPGGCRL